MDNQSRDFLPFFHILWEAILRKHGRNSSEYHVIGEPLLGTLLVTCKEETQFLSQADVNGSFLLAQSNSRDAQDCILRQKCNPMHNR